MRHDNTDCMQAMKAASVYLGFSFTRAQYSQWHKEHPEYPTVAQISRRLHGFNQAKVAAGLIPNAARGSGGHYNDQELIEAAALCFSENGHRLNETIYRAWRANHPDAPSPSTIRTRIGSFAMLADELHNQKNPAFKKQLARFIDEQLSEESFAAWADARHIPVRPFLAAHSSNYEQMLRLCLRNFLSKL
ncbi:MAG: hypothetical protein LKI94_08770 [Sporolactobacillus sp.]|nr:hypothetical protein [Sporolactobacillus sp.]